jgi:hypothetical protein
MSKQAIDKIYLVIPEKVIAIPFSLIGEVRATVRLKDSPAPTEHLSKHLAGFLP